MQKVYILLTFIIGSTLQLLGQSEKESNYVKGEVIVHFRDGKLNREHASTFSKSKLALNQFVKDVSLQRKLDSLGAYRIRKLISESSPDRKLSVSRTGENVGIPDFYNLTILDVPENIDVPKLCKVLNKLYLN